jgi:hypothetical protein
MRGKLEKGPNSFGTAHSWHMPPMDGGSCEELDQCL